MQLDVYIENVGYTIEVDKQDIANGQPFFSQMDKDMDGGWRMGPEYVHEPDITQRCQIVAERLMLSMEKQNESMVRAMAAYIVWRIPDIRELHVDTTGEPLLTEIVT